MKMQLASLCLSALVGGAQVVADSASVVPSSADDPMRLDWYRQGLGAVSHAAFSKEAVYTGSDSGVVASVAQADGSVKWRRVLPGGGAVDALALRLGVLVSLSEEGRRLNFFKAKDGALKAGAAVYSRLARGGDAASAAALPGTPAIAAGDGSGTDGAAVATGGAEAAAVVDLQLFALGGSSKSSDQRVAVVANNAVSVYGLDGKPKWSWDGAAAGCAISHAAAGDADVRVACQGGAAAYSLDAKLGGWTALEGDDRAVAAPPAGGARGQGDDPAAVAAAGARLAAAAADTPEHWERLEGAAVAAAFPSLSAGGGMAVTLADGAFVMLTEAGRVAFVREEGLSELTQVVAVDLDRRTAATAAGHLNKLSGASLPERLASQAAMFLSFVAEMPSELVALFADASSAAAGGDTFVHSIGKKVIVAVSQRGRVFALDSVSGAVRWSRQLAQGPAELRVVAASVAGGVQVLVVDAEGAASTVVLDVLTGTRRGDAEGQPRTVDAAGVRQVLRVAMPASAERAQECAETGDEHACRAHRATVLAHVDGAVTVVGTEFSTADVAAALGAVHGGRLFFQHVDAEAGVVSGLVLEAHAIGALRNREVWSLPLGDARGDAAGTGSVLEACAVVDAHEKIQVIGLPFGDDGVLLKYINPNMMACAVSHPAAGDDEEAVATVDVVVLDTVTGRSLYRHSHEDAAGPVQMVFSENMLVYSFARVDNAARTELSSVALFETSLGAYDLLPWKSLDRKGDFSSFDEQMPVVLQKTFTYPEGVRRLAVSKTAHGVSEKAFLVYTSSGRVAFLRRDLLDPRRPDKAPTATPKPGDLRPYHGHLVQVPTDIVSYHLVVEDAPAARGQPALLLSFPTHMESTSEVLLAGLDLFYARFAPSTPYDMLPEEFQKQIIVLVSVVVTAGVAVAHSMALKKGLAQVWK